MFFTFKNQITSQPFYLKLKTRLGFSPFLVISGAQVRRELGMRLFWFQIHIRISLFDSCKRNEVLFAFCRENSRTKEVQESSGVGVAVLL